MKVGIEVVPPEGGVVREEGGSKRGGGHGGGIVRHDQQVAIVGIGVIIKQPSGSPVGRDGLKIEVNDGGPGKG